MTPDAPDPMEVRRVVALFQQGLDDQLIPAAQALTQRHPLHGLGWMLLGAGLKRQGQYEKALQPMQQAVRLLPGRAELHSNLGTTYYHLGRHAEAEHCYLAARQIEPDHAAAVFNLGRLRTRQGRFEEALGFFDRLLELNPDDAEAHAERGIARGGLQQWVAAESSLRHAIALGYRDATAFDHLGRSLLEQGRPGEAVEKVREALLLKPESAALLSSFLFAWNHLPAPLPRSLPEEAGRLDRALASAVPRPIRWRCEPAPDVLRVGLVSGDFRRHPVGSFLASFVQEVQAGAVALHGYSTLPGEDAVTLRLKSGLAGWRSLVDVPAAKAAEAIAADGMHVLIDLSGHTAGSRHDVFAHRPAPVQVTWLGIPASTGLSCIDRILGVGEGDASRDQVWFSERLHPLPESWFCYGMLEAPPDVVPPPVTTHGHLTFGSFNSMTKINDAVIAVWARILAAVPDARLLLRNWQFNEQAAVHHLERRFAERGIDAGRLTLEGPRASLAEHLAQYSRIDVALDPFPFAGGTTTAEALFMGVPVLTLKGSGRMLRIGENMLRLAGLPEWIAADEDLYVAGAVEAARHPARLIALRGALRARLQATSLFDGRRFGRFFAGALWDVWRDVSPAKLSGA